MWFVRCADRRARRLLKRPICFVCAQSPQRHWSTGVAEWWSAGLNQYSITPTLHAFCAPRLWIFYGACREPFQQPARLPIGSRDRESPWRQRRIDRQPGIRLPYLVRVRGDDGRRRFSIRFFAQPQDHDCEPRPSKLLPA